MSASTAATSNRAGSGNADVQAFYERFPYPPPVGDLGAYRKRWEDPARRRADFHLVWPRRPYREDFTVLVAGCGTSQAAKHALRWPKARVVGIDFSEASIAHTLSLKRRYRLDNLEARQLPLERAHGLGILFDQIVCTGVLHHMTEPDAGLGALRGVLAPRGAMHLMLYAPYGRQGIAMMQDFVRLAGICASADGVRLLLTALDALPANHPLAALLSKVPDFRDESALADTLLNPRERAYSVPQLFDFLRHNGMQFGRWLRQAPYSVRAGVLARVAASLGLDRLSREAQFAAAELFRGTMLHHSLIAYRDDDEHPGIGFAGPEWLSYVPIRVPDTIVVDERPPAGAAAVLINRTHTDTDIVLPVCADEKRLFGTIDGERTIGDILAHGGRGMRHEPARAFLERLFWHDQVVFDASVRASSDLSRA